MKVSIEEIGACKRELRVELPVEDVRTKVEEAYRHVGRTARIPGFRKGKVPRNLLKVHFKEEVRTEVLRNIVSTSYQRALEESKLTPVGEPELEEIQFEEDKPLIFKATFEVKPDFDVKDYTGVVVSKNPVEVTEQEVDRVLELFRDRAAQYIPMEGWPALYGDLVYLDYEGLIEDRPFKGGKGENQPFILGSRGFLPGFDERVIGMGKGESKAFNLQIPEDYPREDLAGKKVALKVTVKDIKKKQLLPLDDEFAKAFGGVETIGEFREKMKQDLLLQKERAQEAELKRKIIEKVIEAHSLEIPEAMVEFHLQHLVSDGLRRMAAQGMDVKALNMEELRESFRKTAQRQARAILVLEAIADKEGIQVSEEELAREIESLAASANVEPKAMRAYLEERGRWEAFKAELRERKTVDFLYSHARIVEGGSLILV